MIGSTIFHYQILGELGRGGMGIVYRAVDTRLGREVALKFLPEEVVGNEAALARFRREARAASALNHPNICTLFDIGEHAGRHFIAMELLRGQSLGERLEAGPMAVEEVHRLGVQLASALEVSHAQGIVHRDVKPRNIFLTERGDAKLLDFGLAKAAPQSDSTATGLTLEAEADLTQEQRVVGTPSYMSPEQVLGRPLDSRSDLFSLGAVLYYMATGRRPFQAESVPATLDAVLHRDPAPVRTINSKASVELERIVRRSLAKDLHARYQTAGDLREDLERLATGSFVPPRRPRGRVMALAGAAIVAIALLAAGAGMFWERESETVSSSPVIAVMPFTNQTGDPAQDYLGPALSGGLSSELGELRALRLVSSGMLGSDREAAIRKAQDLGAQIIVEGDVRTAAGDDLRIAARVTDARSGLVLWSQPFEGGVEDLLELEGRMARGLAGFLAIPLSRRERGRLGAAPTASLEAMRLYAEGSLLIEGSAEGQGRERAIRAFESAVRLDPGFALAHAALSQAIWTSYESSGDEALLAQAVAAANRAVEIDPELPQARLALALAKGPAGGTASDLEQVASILASHSRPAAALRELGLIYERSGLLDQAESAFREATAQDPDDWFNWNWLGVFLFKHRGLDAAKSAWVKAVELAPPGVTRPRQNLAALAVQQSRFEEAITLLEEVPHGSADGSTANTLATAYFFSNRPDKWQQAEKLYLEAVAREPKRSEYRGNLADLYVAIGRSDDALARYREAMSLAGQEGTAKPGDTQAGLLVALYAAKGEQCDQALPMAADLRQKAAAGSQSLHQLALVFALCRDRDRALDALAGAIELGFPGAFAAQEEEFRWLATDPEFEALVAPAGERRAAGRPVGSPARDPSSRR